MDKWLLSRLNTTVKAVDENLSAYKVPEAPGPAGLCGRDEQLVCAPQPVPVLGPGGERRPHCRLYDPVHRPGGHRQDGSPHGALYERGDLRNLVCSVDKSAPESVHLCLYPAYEGAWVDKQLEADMDEVLRIVTQGRAARNLSSLKNRQPLQALYTDADQGLGELYTEIIKQELNVKELVFLTDMSQFTDYTFKPQLKLLGKKLGKRLNEVRQALQELDGAAAKKELDTTGLLKLPLPGGEVDLTAEELLIETAQKEGYTSVSDRGLTVVLDTTLTQALIDEGFVREITSKLQTMRKEAGFNVTDTSRSTARAARRLPRSCGKTSSPFCTTCWEKPAISTSWKGTPPSRTSTVKPSPLA